MDIKLLSTPQVASTPKSFTDEELFFATSGPRDAKLMIIGEAWGKEEAANQAPFVGGSGQELDRMLMTAGISRDEVLCTNLVNAQPPYNDFKWYFYKTQTAKKEGISSVKGLYPRGELIRSLERLYSLIRRVNPACIIGLGNYPLWALTTDSYAVADEGGYKVPTGIGTWRGSQLYTDASIGRYQLVPTYHPAAILRTWPWRRFFIHDLRSRVAKYRGQEYQWEEPSYKFEIRPTYERTIGILDFLLREAELARTQGRTLLVANDLETRAGHIACIGLAWSMEDAICIPIMCVEKDEGYWSLEEELSIYDRLHKLLTHPAVQIAGQNYNYDRQYFMQDCLFIPSIHYDTMTMWHTLWPGETRNLSHISSMVCKYHRHWKDDGKEWTLDVPEEVLWVYNCTDCIRTWEGALHLIDVLKENDLYEQYETRIDEMDLALTIMQEGLLPDPRRQLKYALDLEEAALQREEWLEAVIPNEWWPRKKGRAPWYTSYKQQAEIFYDLIGLPEQSKRGKKGKKSSRTVNDEALENLKLIEPVLYPLFNTIQEYRSIDKIEATHVLVHTDPDGYLRCMADITATVTFRWATKENAFGRGSNLQNIPRNRPKDD